MSEILIRLPIFVILPEQIYLKMNPKKSYLILLVFLMIHGCTNEFQKFTIYTIGDSTMADRVPEVYPETGWCQVLNSCFDAYVTVSNHAVNGSSTKSFIDENRWQVVLDSLKKGDYIFIQFGHNDEKDYDTTRYTTPFGIYAGNLEKITGDWVRSLGDEQSKEYYLWTLPDDKYPEGRQDDTHLSVKGANQVAQLALQECARQKLPFAFSIK